MRRILCGNEYIFSWVIDDVWFEGFSSRKIKMRKKKERELLFSGFRVFSRITEIFEILDFYLKTTFGESVIKS